MLGSSIGYVVPSLMTSTAFHLAINDTTFEVGSHLQPLNFYTMTIGDPGMGKSPAIERSTVLLHFPSLVPPKSKMLPVSSSGWRKGIGFLISVPFALKPTPQEEESATQYLESHPFCGFQAFFRAVERALRTSP